MSAPKRTGVDINGVWDGSLIDKAARWLEERNGPGEWTAPPSGDHCGRHDKTVQTCGACAQQRWRVANPNKVREYAKKRRRDR